MIQSEIDELLADENYEIPPDDTMANENYERPLYDTNTNIKMN